MNPIENPGSPSRALRRTVERALKKARLLAVVLDPEGREWRDLYWWETALPNGTIFPLVTNRNRGPGDWHYTRDLAHAIASSLHRRWDLPVTGPGRHLIVQHSEDCLAVTSGCICSSRVVHIEHIEHTEQSSGDPNSVTSDGVRAL